MTHGPALPAPPLVSLFGAYRPDGEGAPKPLVVELLAPRGPFGWFGGARELPAVVRGEDMAEAALATAELALRLAVLECRVRFTDDAGTPHQILVRGRLDAGCLRARTELTGCIEGPGGARLGSVLLRLNWRAVRLKR